MESHKVSIVIPTKNDEEVLDMCLRSIKDLDYPIEDYEVIIVDGNSTDRTIEIARNYDVKVFYESVGTIGGARNIGVENSNGKYIAFTDADCVVEKNWLKVLVGKLETLDIASIGGANITPDDDYEFAKSVGTVLSFLSGVGARYGFNSEEEIEIYHNPTCNVAYNKKIFQEAGGFNKKLITCDDEELDYRLKKKGLKILFTPYTTVLHYRRPTWRKFVKMALNYGIGRMQAIKLHRRMGKWFHFVPPTAILLFSFLFLMSLLNPLFALTVLSLSLFGAFGVGIMSLYLSVKHRKNFFDLYGLITIWFFGYGIGMLKGLYKE